MNELVKQSRLKEKVVKPAVAPTYEYHEIPTQSVDRLDVLEQLKANVAQIEDLHGRLQFVMSEVQSLIKRR